MSIRAKLETMKKALDPILPDVRHYGGGAPVDRYIDWMEDGEGSSFSHDNTKDEQALHFVIDYYSTPKHVGIIPDAIQSALLTTCGASWRLLNVTKESQSETSTSTKYIHYQWEAEL